MIPPNVAGFNSSIRVPGFYGQTDYGASPISAASIPLVLLLVGTMLTGGTATPNQDIVPITTPDQADACFLPGSELAEGCYAALGAASGITLLAAPVPEAGSAVAATLTLTITGTWPQAGTIGFRLNGEVVLVNIAANASVTQAAAAIVLALNSDARRPYIASSAAGVVTITIKSKGARGNLYILFQDLTQGPTGLASAIAGGTPVTGGGVPFTGGVGTESVATLLTIIGGHQYDRIVPAQNDATNLGLWSNELNTLAGSTSNILDHLIYATNGLRSAALTIATGLNQQRISPLLMVNCETHPFIIASGWGAIRCSTEQTDPAASSVYDDMPMPWVAPQSQVLDRPTLAQLNSSINAGVSEIYTDATGTTALMSRSVTSHTLNGAAQDYRTLDTSQAYVPDYIRRDFGLFWHTSFKVQNPRVDNNPPDGVKEHIAGVAYPDLWNVAVIAKLRKYEVGDLSSDSAPTAPTISPIIVDVDDNLPVSVFSGAQQCILSDIPTKVAPAQHQIGVIVSQVS